MYPLISSARIVFRAALLIFVVTIVIGILNGMDIWQPSHNVLLTHVHAGTLGWITLSVIGAAMLMFGEGAGSDEVRASNTLAMGAVGATVLYVVAFATGTGIFRPIAGTIMLAAIVWALVWVWKRFSSLAIRSSHHLAMLLTMISLTMGAVLGVILGLFIARGSVPGLSDDTAGTLAGAHPPAMLIGYLILAGVAITDWLLDGPPGRIGPIVAWSLFVAGIVVNIAIMFDIEALIQVATLLEVLAIILVLIRMWSRIKPSAWSGGGGANFARMSIVFLAIGIALLVNVVRLFISGELDPESNTGPIGALLAFDHAMFIGVMTNALFAVVASTWGPDDNRISLWAVNGGLALFLVGLLADTPILKQIGAPVMGLALLHAIAVYYMATGREPKRAVTQ
ncbi:MAG: hypothetical protein WD274_13960 [Acidimicrobiia bacterium]